MHLVSQPLPPRLALLPPACEKTRIDWPIKVCSEKYAVKNMHEVRQLASASLFPSSINTLGEMNICSNKWPYHFTDYCAQVYEHVSEQTTVLPTDLISADLMPMPQTLCPESALVEADVSVVRDSSLLLLACWFMVFVQLLLLSEKK